MRHLMKFKAYYFLIALLNALSLYSQETQEKVKKHKNILGVEAGYPLTSEHLGYKFETNLHYYYNYKIFLLKAKIGFTPNTNFGLVTKYYLGLGLSTSLNRNISINILFGPGIALSSRPEYTFWSDANYLNYYYYGTLSPVIEIGVFISPLKDKSVLIGINSSIMQESYFVSKSIESLNYTLSTNITFSKKLKHGKK